MMDRGRVRSVEILDGQVLLDLTLDSGEVRTKVALMLPSGITAIPQPGADVILARVGSRDEDLVALQADDGASRVSTAVSGDWAVRAHGATALIAAAGITITGFGAAITITTAGVSFVHDTLITLDAPTIKLGAGATKKIALNGDSALGFVVRASAAKVLGQ